MKSFEEFKSVMIKDYEKREKFSFLETCTVHDWDVMYKGCVKSWEADNEEG